MIWQINFGNILIIHHQQLILLRDDYYDNFFRNLNNNISKTNFKAQDILQNTHIFIEFIFHIYKNLIVNFLQIFFLNHFFNYYNH